MGQVNFERVGTSIIAQNGDDIIPQTRHGLPSLNRRFESCSCLLQQVLPLQIASNGNIILLHSLQLRLTLKYMDGFLSRVGIMAMPFPSHGYHIILFPMI